MDVTALIELVAASIILVTTIVGVVQTRYGRKETREVHVLVNSQLTDVLNRVKQLEQELEQQGIAIPDKE